MACITHVFTQRIINVPFNSDLPVGLRRQGDPDEVAGVVAGIIPTEGHLTASRRVAVQKSK